MLLVLQLLLFLAYCLFRVKQMKVLLSPAKAIDISKRINTKVCTEPAFIDEAQGLVNKLAKLSAKKIGSMIFLILFPENTFQITAKRQFLYKLNFSPPCF